MPDEKIPGTLNVGHALRRWCRRVIFMTLVEVEFTTLVTIIAAAVVGAWLGAGVVAGLPRRQGAARHGHRPVRRRHPDGALADRTSGRRPAWHSALSGAKLAIAVGISVVLGALMMLGIGFYAPCLIMISLLGMDPKAAYPIMMGACAFLMPAGSIQFIRKESYDLKAALGLLDGRPGARF